MHRSFRSSSSPLFLRDCTLPKVSVGRMILESSHFPSPATPHALLAAFRFLPVSGARVSDVSLNKVQCLCCAAG